nr:hypothetical protein [Tanacetum cinerariifolium]
KNLDENIQKIIKEQVKEQVKVQVSKILPKIEKTVNEKLEADVLTQSSNSSKTSYVVVADLLEMELKKILIENMESNKRRDDADKDEEPFAGSDRGSKRHREGKEPDSISVPKEKATKTTGKSTHGSKSQQKTASESAPAEELMQTIQDLEDPHIKSLKQVLLMINLLQTLLSILNDTLTPEFLARQTYELMKGSCKSLVELEFFLEEVYKPLPLIPNSRGRLVIPFDHFINNDLEYLRGGASSRNYITFVTKIKAADYSSTDLLSTGNLLEMSTLNVESSLSLNFRLSSGIITSIWIGSRKADKSDGQRTLCFQRISKNVHKKHRHLTVYGRSSTSDGMLNDVRTALDDPLKGI